MQESRQPISKHLTEVKHRLLLLSALGVVFFTIAWIFRVELTDFYLLPLSPVLKKIAGKVVVTKVFDLFLLHVKTSIFVTILALLPVALYSFWGFLAPGLHEHEKKTLRALLVLGSSLFYLGVIICYFTFIPFVLHFFIDYWSNSSPLLEKMQVPQELLLSLPDYVSFTQTFLLIFGPLFEFPLIIYGLYSMGVISIEDLTQYRRHAIVICFVASAIFTPPDPISMVCMGIPMVLLYELGIFICKKMEKRAAVPSSALAMVKP
ncbi:MAG: twin-arginine translocase subunit TatC [Oligoflexia bacterium]|nr:twin-arginine translocase subunit TatC [Oligoflexia bacterium]MBF0366898.1 twin-arginine translocase subunit TatC [Oligoflexia bacterium]